MPFKQKAKNLWGFFTLYEKIWFFSILILAIIFTFLFPETDDPTYTVTYTAEADFNVIDFTGSEDLTVYSVTIDGTEYSVKDFLGVNEYSVTEENPDTFLVKLPQAVKAGSVLSFECLPEGENGTIVFSAGGYKNDFSVENFSGNINVTENAPKYLVSVGFLMFLYLADTITNITCELLISKQSKWNFLVSLLVEVIEIVICIVCAYRFATLAVTILFWIPCDIISFFTWNKHLDKDDKQLTVVKKLTVKQDILLVLGIIIWTVVIGYLLTFIEVEGGIFYNNVLLKNISCYLDACVSAVGIANGLFILFRYREQWIAWYISAILETIINIMAGQYVLLVLKAGYFTNTTYGYIKWTKYIKNHKQKNIDKPEPATV